MALAHRLQPLLSSALTSPRLRNLVRQAHEVRRRVGRAPHQVTAWLKLDDPYSYLLLQVLPALLDHFRISLRLRFLQGLPEAMYPEPDMLADYALTDALLLARRHQLSFPERVSLPCDGDLALGNRILLGSAALSEGQQLLLAQEVFAAVWEHQPATLASLAEHFPPLDEAEADTQLLTTREALEAEGHYLAGTLQYGGEWYWGVDRLVHLVKRLEGLGTARTPHPFMADERSLHSDHEFLVSDHEQLARLRALHLPLDFFFSFRSPYSYLALTRVFALAAHYGLTLTVKPVLPMVMRGLAVPTTKRFYILRDARREADRLGVPFGRVCDPVGVGVERCLAVYGLAAEQGRAQEYLLSVATGIWAEGRNVADDREFRLLVERAGLAWPEVVARMADVSWINEAEQNRQELEAMGLWGVPVLCLQTPRQVLTVWGQDRIWAIEAAIAELASVVPGIETEMF